VTSVDDVDAVVIGSAVYADRWVPEAADLVVAQASSLRRLPVWLFSSGPVGGEGSRELRQQQQLAELVGARASAQFGGALDRATDGPVDGHLVHVGPGDWRDEQGVRRWARQIAAALHVEAAPA